MKNIKILTLLLLSSFAINAQMLTNAGVNAISGGFVNTNNSLSFSVGQTVIGTYNSTNTMLTNGTLQPEIINIIPTTQMSNGVCGTLNFVRTSAITCLAVSGATQYEWQFSSGSGVYATKTTTTNYVLLHTVTPVLNWGTNWNIKVRAKIGANVGPYSPDCNIGIMPDPSISGVPLTQLRTQDCGRLNYRINANNRIIADPVSGAAQYEFEFSLASTGAIIATKLQTNNVVFLNTITPNLTFPAQYNVRVRARIGGTWGTFGAPCLIGIIGANREEDAHANNENELVIEINEFYNIDVMPNPFNDQANIVVNSNDDEMIQLEVMDMLGKTILNQDIQSNTKINFGQELAQGNYMLRAINSKGKQAIFKLVKVN